MVNGSRTLETFVAVTDAELVQRSLQGDRRSFGVLVSRHQESVFAMISRLIREQNEVEDVAQECFIRAFRALGSFRGDSKFTTWLYRIVHNTCLTRREQQAKKQAREVSIYVDDDEGEETTMSLADEDALLPDEILEASDVRERLLRHLKELPEHYRSVLVLYYYEQRSYQEIAEILDAPMNTVKVHILRAKKQLKKRLLADSSQEEWE
jgi:RNA polymerase sigma-70 factor, ECF subfamily